MVFSTFVVTWFERVAIDHGHSWLDRNQSLALWLTALATALLATGVGVAWWAVRDSKKTRHAQLVLALDGRWIDPAITRATKLYGNYTNQGIADLVSYHFDPTTRPPTKQESDDYEALSDVANLIETMGALHSDGAITDAMIYKVWGGPIVDIWRAWRLALPELRRLRKEDDIFQNFNDLGKKMEKRLPKS